MGRGWCLGAANTRWRAGAGRGSCRGRGWCRRGAHRRRMSRALAGVGVRGGRRGSWLDEVGGVAVGLVGNVWVVWGSTYFLHLRSAVEGVARLRHLQLVCGRNRDPKERNGSIRRSVCSRHRHPPLRDWLRACSPCSVGRATKGKQLSAILGFPLLSRRGRRPAAADRGRRRIHHRRRHPFFRFRG